MSKIAIAPEVSYPAKILVEAAWLEQLTEEAQTAAQMVAGLVALTQDSDCGKFAVVICSRVQEVARQLEQMQEE